ncbi:LuxR C-terminal-related transcriptional regulator [Nocardia sp. NPDC050408]|uniref:LuxR C-terminal-related transcriptional regulator n=1 Tax=Nocardia sp. NPDC050408 TaxID=3364319 RepID=UPI0037AA2A73
MDALTNRQRETAVLVATGMTNRMIATQLQISEWTVVDHVRQVMQNCTVGRDYTSHSWSSAAPQSGAVDPRRHPGP